VSQSWCCGSQQAR